MTNVRIVMLALFALACRFPATGQSVVSTHSGVVYFFTGAVYVGDQRLEQRFGRFPDIPEGREMRTETGRAEVLLTPGVMLRVAENSNIRMISNKLSDTQVELVSGSAIVESNDPPKDTSVTLIHKTWKMHLSNSGVYRIDSAPARVQSYKGEVEVAADGQKDPVSVKEGETLPLAEVLLADKSEAAPDTDSFKTWAMNRSQAVAADNATASEIIDDPSQLDTASSLAWGGFTYFPPTGMPSLGIGNPYGLSFWSPYQSTLTAMWNPIYMYGGYPGYGGYGGYGMGFGSRAGWPVSVRPYPSPVYISRPGYLGPRSPIWHPGVTTPHPIYSPPPRVIGRPTVGVHAPAVHR